MFKKFCAITVIFLSTLNSVFASVGDFGGTYFSKNGGLGSDGIVQNESNGNIYFEEDGYLYQYTQSGAYVNEAYTNNGNFRNLKMRNNIIYALLPDIYGNGNYVLRKYDTDLNYLGAVIINYPDGLQDYDIDALGYIYVAVHSYVNVFENGSWVDKSYSHLDIRASNGTLLFPNVITRLDTAEKIENVRIGDGGGKVFVKYSGSNNTHPRIERYLYQYGVWGTIPSNSLVSEQNYVFPGGITIVDYFDTEQGFTNNLVAVSANSGKVFLFDADGNNIYETQMGGFDSLSNPISIQGRSVSETYTTPGYPLSANFISGGKIIINSKQIAYGTQTNYYFTIKNGESIVVPPVVTLTGTLNDGNIIYKKELSKAIENNGTTSISYEKGNGILDGYKITMEKSIKTLTSNVNGYLFNVYDKIAPKRISVEK